MRITDVRIESYGRLKDRRFHLSDGFNVFYGPNESGKTTTMEFIRNTLVPNGKRSTYPAKSKSDSGNIVYEQDGVTRTIQYDRSGDAPECLENMDPSLYRSIFALNQSGLDDIDVVSNGEIRTRFLTIPGGETVPDAVERIDKKIGDIVGKVGSSPSEINRIQKRRDELNDRIATLRSNTESYSEMNDRLDELTKVHERLTKENSAVQKNNEMFARVESQRSSFDNLARLRSERSELQKKPIAGRESQSQYNAIETELKGKRSVFDALDSTRKEQKARLSVNEREVSTILPRMENVLSRRNEYETRPTYSPEPVRTVSKTRFIVPLIIIAMMAVVWMVPGPDTMFKVGIDVVGVILIVITVYMMKHQSMPVQTDNNQWVEGYESEIISLIGSLGRAHSTFASDLDVLQNTISVMAELQNGKDAWSNAQLEMMRSENKRMGFLSSFGGEEGYKQAVINAERLSTLESNISILEKNIVASGFDPDLPLPEVQRIEIDMTRQNELSKEIGSLRQQMEHVLDTKELDRMIDESVILNSELDRAVKEGAKAILSSAIMQGACEEMYSSVQPGVISTADRYLSLMTGGKYRMDLDPRNTGLSIISDEGQKGPKQWSTGLRAQVLLSIKLAIAKEMGNGEVPMILDDVLLPFDSDRKKGACIALSQLAKEMQIIMFTCDDRIPSILQDIGAVNSELGD